MVLKNPVPEGGNGFEKPQSRGGNGFEKVVRKGSLGSENRQSDGSRNCPLLPLKLHRLHAGPGVPANGAGFIRQVAQVGAHTAQGSELR